LKLKIDERWLLELQERYVPEESHLVDFTALSAAIARHRAAGPRVGYEADAAWAAACLAHTVVQLTPMASRNELFACVVTFSYMAAAGEAIHAQYGELNQLVRDARSGAASVFELADRIRAWRV
jgi:hypothetical protein